MQNNDRGEELSTEALFDSLGHPIRVKILEALNGTPLSFSEIKRKVGIDSSGHLTFHLDKLKGLIKINTDGNYELADDGKEALRLISVFNTGVKECSEPKKDWKQNSNVVWAAALIAIVLISAVSINGMYGTYLALRNDEGKEQTWSIFWRNVDDARIHILNSMAAVYANDLCAARYELAVAEVYLDLVIFKTEGLNQLGQDCRILCDEGIHYIYLLKPTLSTIRESMANGSVTDGQLVFLDNLASALNSLLNSMQHEEGGPFTINDVYAIINQFKALAETAC